MMVRPAASTEGTERGGVDSRWKAAGGGPARPWRHLRTPGPTGVAAPDRGGGVPTRHRTVRAGDTVPQPAHDPKGSCIRGCRAGTAKTAVRKGLGFTQLRRASLQARRGRRVCGVLPKVAGREGARFHLESASKMRRAESPRVCPARMALRLDEKAARAPRCRPRTRRRNPAGMPFAQRLLSGSERSIASVDGNGGWGTRVR